MTDTVYAHFTVNPYDPTLDYPKLCTELFGTNKCLVMLESKNRDHLHIQGQPAVTEKVYNRILSEYTLLHYRKKQDPKTHPIKKRARPADEKGFQYMSKELPKSVVIYKQGLTDEDLKELYEASEAHRSELQEGLTDYIKEHVTTQLSFCDPDQNPSYVHKLACKFAVRYYQVNHKMQPPNLRLLVRHALATHFYSPAMEDYLASLIL